MGNACISAEETTATQKATMRQTGVEAPPAALMHGGVIRLTANADHLLDFAPLPQHDDWLQGRLTREEWSELILSINDSAVDSFLYWSMVSRLSPAQRHAQRPAAAEQTATRLRTRWLERGLDLVADSGPPLALFFKPVPIGSSPIHNAAGIGDSSGAGAATGTLASLPPAYPADNAPPGGLNAAAPAVASVYAFPIVVKPAPTHSAAGPDAISDNPVASAVWRFCPHCGSSVDPHNAGKAFCPDCAGKWR